MQQLSTHANAAATPCKVCEGADPGGQIGGITGRFCRWTLSTKSLFSPHSPLQSPPYHFQSPWCSLWTAFWCCAPPSKLIKRGKVAKHRRASVAYCVLDICDCSGPPESVAPTSEGCLGVREVSAACRMVSRARQLYCTSAFGRYLLGNDLLLSPDTKSRKIDSTDI